MAASLGSVLVFTSRPGSLSPALSHQGAQCCPAFAVLLAAQEPWTKAVALAAGRCKGALEAGPAELLPAPIQPLIAVGGGSQSRAGEAVPDVSQIRWGCFEKSVWAAPLRGVWRPEREREKEGESSRGSHSGFQKPVWQMSVWGSSHVWDLFPAVSRQGVSKVFPEFKTAAGP